MTARQVPLDPPLAGPDAEDARRLARFRALIQEGVDDMEAGRFETVDDIGAWLDGLGRTPPA